MTEVSEWQSRVKAFNEARAWGKPEYLKDLLLNMCEEVGECWNVVKWVDGKRGVELVRKHKDEVEDFVGQQLYLALKIAYLSEVDGERALRRTLEEFEHRFPVERAKGSHSNLRAGGVDRKYAER
jgi:NTP pyrophosphatase (non-canonical NTP hydrolase)